MPNNLFISYDLNSPGQNYEAVVSAIKSLGSWAWLQKSVWYVNSSYSADAAGTRVIMSMDRDDSLLVIDATNNSAYWRNIGSEASEFVRTQWYR
ncbi:MAG: hypothetical protein CMF25_06525 [Kangiellaceae bacterium]|nr:hypothetical protein [Kangiellaceae bacterium]